MKPKLLVAVVTLVVLAVTWAVTRRATETVPVSRPAAAATAAKAAPADLKSHPALASYRVYEDPAEEGVLPFRGANYSAEVRRDGLRFQAKEHQISLRARRVEQGGVSVELSDGEPVKTRFGAVSVERAEGIAEEFVFENRRAEHLVRVDRPVGEGALVVRVAVETSLTGQVQQIRRGDSSWKDTALMDGGLVFTDAAGKPGLAYHGAVAVDAAGRRQLFDPRWENGEIALEVPASFMKDAAYPVLIDPWLELNFSGSGNGVSATGSVSETPAITLLGNGSSPAVAWSDASDGDFDIYFRFWTGFEWIALGTDNVSANSGSSTNPAIGHFTPSKTTDFHPFIAWEDDSAGTINIYAKFWTGTSWSALGGSATGSGISKSIGTICKNPQAVGVDGFVENDPLSSEPNRFETFPVVLWEVEGVGLRCKFFYPGDNRLQAPEATWYDHPSGAIPAGPTAARPSATIDSLDQLVVAWEESTGTQFDIFVARAGTAGGAFSVSNGTPIVGPASVWTLIGNASGASAALSIQPSVAVDGDDDIWVAWRESVGAESEIFVSRSVGGGAFGQVGGSMTGGGVSRTNVLGVTTNSSFPSIAVARVPGVAQRPAVAWEDDAGSNLDIYLRRLNAGGSAWDQVADEGSALLVLPDTTGNAGGISRTPSFSLRPKTIVAPDGTITVAWRDGAAGTFDLLVRRYHDNQPSTLAQGALSGAVLTPLTTGTTSSSTTIQFSGIVIAESLTLPTTLRLQLEIRPNTTAFTGQPTHDSLEVASGATAIVVFTGLPNVNYHWRARSLDAQGRGSPWVSFGGNADGQIDFRIDSTAVGSGSTNNVQGVSSEHKDKCGLMGLEVLALISLAAFARRRRKA